MKPKFYLVLLLMWMSAFAWAQNRQVTGTVTDETTGSPLSGASVVVRGSNQGTTTNEQGKFTVTLPANKTKGDLDISLVGYPGTTVSVEAGKAANVRIRSASSTMSDVVVVGYATVRRKDLTGSVSSVSSKELKDIPINSAAEALSGRLAGVQVKTSEGAPGADVDVYVRGRNSITQSGSPLYIVDGVQVENALSVLSPQDIESVDVLKDAASTAIYGARGSNGVIIITTKGGKNTGGKTTVTYNGFFGTSKLSRELDMMDPYNFVLYQYERAKYTENATDTGTAAQYIKRMSNFDTIGSTYRNYVNPINWQQQTMGRRAKQQTHNVSVTGGTAATQYNLSLTYNKQEGLLRNSDYDRKLASFRFDHKVSEKLKVGFNVRYNIQEVLGAGTSDVGGAGSNRLRQYTRYRPLILPGQTEDYYDPDLDARNPGNGLNLLNPLQLMAAEYRVRKLTAYNFNGYLNYNLTKKLSVRSTFGYDVNMTENKGYDDTLTANARTWSRLPVLIWGKNERFAVNNSNVVSYSNPSLFKTKHTLDFLVGHEIYETKTKTENYEVRYFPIGVKPDIAFSNLALASPPAGFTQPKGQTTEVEVKQVSFFSRINYSYNKQYLLTLNFRADGSSLFGPNFNSPIPPPDPTNRKWGYFPSASIAWRLSQEPFMQSIGFLSDAKVRLSYGTSGNNRINPYGYITPYSLAPNGGGYGVSDVINYTLVPPTRLGNPAIKWESLTSKNVGLDLGLFNNRLNAVIDLYSNVTKNLLLENAFPPTSGYTTQYQNVGTTRNNGLEIQLSGTALNTKDFNWNSSFNISFNKNKIISLGKQTQFTANSGWFSSTANPNDYLIKVGEEVGTMYGLVVDGFYKPSDFVIRPYVNATYNALYPNLTHQYTLDPKLPNPAAVLADQVAPGQIKYRDMNGDGKITLDSDRVVIGHALPKFTGGFNNQLTYKNIDLSFFINFSYGNDIMNANRLEYSTSYGVDANMLKIMEGRWKVINNQGQLIQKQLPTSPIVVVGIDSASLAGANANASIWQPIRTTTGFYPSSFAVEDGSFIRLGNVTIGYSLPKSLIKKAKITSLRVYATGSNLVTRTKYSGYDPDVSSRRGALTPGVDYAAYPRGRTYVFGVNLSF